jgi:hypothetical protein
VLAAVEDAKKPAKRQGGGDAFRVKPGREGFDCPACFVGCSPVLDNWYRTQGAAFTGFAAGGAAETRAPMGRALAFLSLQLIRNIRNHRNNNSKLNKADYTAVWRGVG